MLKIRILTSFIASWSSASVGFCPRDRITAANSFEYGDDGDGGGDDVNDGDGDGDDGKAYMADHCSL